MEAQQYYAQYAQYLQQGYMQGANTLSPEEQLQQYNAQMKQYEEYQQALANQPQKTPEELQQQQMYEYQKQVSEYEKYQKDLAEYENQKLEWEKQNGYAQGSGQAFYGQSAGLYGNYGSQVQGMAPVAGVSPLGHTTQRMYTCNRTISLPFVHLGLMRSKKNEIENGAKARLTILHPPAHGAEFNVVITSGTSASLDIAVAMIDKHIKSPTPTPSATAVPALNSFPVPGMVAPANDTRERCRDFFSSGVCGRGITCIFRHEFNPGLQWRSVIPPFMRGNMMPGRFPWAADDQRKRGREGPVDDARRAVRYQYQDVRHTATTTTTDTSSSATPEQPKGEEEAQKETAATEPAEHNEPTKTNNGDQPNSQLPTEETPPATETTPAEASAAETAATEATEATAATEASSTTGAVATEASPAVTQAPEISEATPTGQSNEPTTERSHEPLLATEASSLASSDTPADSATEQQRETTEAS